MRRLSRFSLLSVFLLLCAGLAFPAPLSVSETGKGLHAIVSAVVSTFAASTSIPSVSLDGVAVEHYDEDTASHVATISYRRCDVIEMAERLRQPETGTSFFRRLISSASSSISPVTRLAGRLADRLDMDRGSAFVDGTVTFSGSILTSDMGSVLFRTYVLRDCTAIDFDVDLSVVVSGPAFERPLSFEGQIEVRGMEDGSINLTSEKMTCNNQKIVISPVSVPAD